jgi:L-ribulokinase
VCLNKNYSKGAFMKDSYLIGVDYGSDSVRALIVHAYTGKIVANHIEYYPRWSKGKYCDAHNNQFRQHPLDYIESLKKVINQCVKSAGSKVVSNIKGISFDTTGSTPCAIDRNGTPLALNKEFANNPNAMFVLWKDHTSVKEAKEITDTAHNWGGIDYTQYIGGIYSSEWFFAKALHILRIDEKVRNAAYSWVEHCDWMPALLTGVKDAKEIKRGRCSSGHKLMWHADYNGLPSNEFFVKIDPLLDDLRDRLAVNPLTNDKPAGIMTDYWAKELGLPKGIVVGIGAFDCHMGAIGAQIKPYSLIKIIGTSTCDILIAPKEDIGNKVVKGICGQVDGSVVPDMIGMEAGQSAFGDVYAWFKKILMWSISLSAKKTSLINDKKKSLFIDEAADNLLIELEKQAVKVPTSKSQIISTDWFNGRRTPDANQLLTASISGLTLGADAPRIYRSLVEATAFGAKRIAECFIEQGIPIKSVIGIGGIAKKSKFIMQTLADILNIPIKIAKSDQVCALGSAICASVVAGIHKDIDQAADSMGSGFITEFKPNAENVQIYEVLYKKYLDLGQSIEKSI